MSKKITNKKELSTVSDEKMTAKEVADALGVAPRSILRATKRYLPNKVVVNGKPTMYSCEEATILQAKMAENLPDNPTLTSTNLGLGQTALTNVYLIQENLKTAQQAFQNIFDLLNKENERLKAENESLESALKYEKVADMLPWRETKKQYNLKGWTIEKIKALPNIEEHIDWEEAVMRDDKHRSFFITMTVLQQLLEV